MQHRYLSAIASTLLLAAAASAQQSADKQAPACVAVPIYHCAEHLEDGGAVGHFGYDLQCPDDAGPDAEIFIDIGDDNLFSPGRVDRGQPKIFISGKHFDEFEADFSAAEVESADEFYWSIQGVVTWVDFIKTQDDHVDCMNLKN
jgi:hypothetical protein